MYWEMCLIGIPNAIERKADLGEKNKAQIQTRDENRWYKISEGISNTHWLPQN
jgi:hypothetical protein